MFDGGTNAGYGRILAALGIATLLQVGMAALVAPAIQMPFLFVLCETFVVAGILSLVVGGLAILPSSGWPVFGTSQPGGTVDLGNAAFSRRLPPDARFLFVGVAYGIALLVASFSLPV